ncbi:hypothetical protein ACHHYP_01653 [Achlya hypogyna]|uniref:Transmembrane protein n=1 Tax=Achlya hypogyna TaxID=1202772 RepID=A0A1V9Z856_ACHHY|nr:hypothetical protein ACHHYP_01653 [Achlya hypogyna]
MVSVDSNYLYECHALPRICNPPAEDKIAACTTLFPDCYVPSGVILSSNGSMAHPGLIGACNRIALLNEVTALPETAACLDAAHTTVLSLLYRDALERDQVRAFNSSAACRTFLPAYAASVTSMAPCTLENLLVTANAWLPPASITAKEAYFQAFVTGLMSTVNVAYAPPYNNATALAARSTFPSNAFLLGGLDSTLRLGSLLALLMEIVVIVLGISVLLRLLGRTCHANPYALSLYHDALRGLAVAGLLSFFITRCVLWGVVAKSGASYEGLLIVQDVMWLVVLINMVQTVVVGGCLFANHRRRSTFAARPLAEYLSVATNGFTLSTDAQVPRRFHEGLDFHLLRHLFLQAHKLPTKYQFDVYLNHVEAAVLVDLARLSWWAWPLVAALYAAVLGIADAILWASRPWSEAARREVEVQAAHLLRSDVVASRVVTLVVVVAIVLVGAGCVAWYLRTLMAGLLAQAGDVINELSMASKVKLLQIVALRETGDVDIKDTIAAIHCMEHMSRTLEETEPAVLPSRLVQMPTWSRRTLLSVAHACTLLPVLMAALVMDALLVLPPAAPGWYLGALFGLLSALLLVSSLLLPYLVRVLGTVLGVACPNRDEVHDAIAASIARLREHASQQKAASAATIVLSPTTRL